MDGKLAPRGEAVKDLGAIVKKYGRTLYKARLEKPKVGILVDVVGLIKTLEQTTETATNKFMYESNAGLFKALYESDITSDMIRMDRGLTPAELKPYKILFLPFQIRMLGVAGSAESGAFGARRRWPRAGCDTLPGRGCAGWRAGEDG